MTEKFSPTTAKGIEGACWKVKYTWRRYGEVKEEVERMLDIVEKVQGEDVVALVLAAAAAVNALADFDHPNAAK